jgi:three-Cys-motif partner protein
MANSRYEWKIGEALPELGEHSLAKHEILDRYLRRYIEICTATPVQEKLSLTIVDGYAGGGRYQIGADQSPGSPIILLTAIAEMEELLNRNRPKGFEIQTEFVFVDSEPLHTDFLRSEISASSFASELDKTIKIWTGDFNELVDDVITIAAHRNRKGRSIFILDQFGWASVTFQSVRKILNSLEKAEIFLTFMVDSLIDYLTEQRIDSDGYQAIGLNGGKVRELLSTKQQDKAWRAIIQNGLYSHLQQSTGAEFYSPFFIHSRKAVTLPPLFPRL